MSTEKPVESGEPCEIGTVRFHADETDYFVYTEQLIKCMFGGARDVIIIVVGNGHGDSSSNPGRE